MAADRSSPIPYSPSVPVVPGELSRATWDELYRIAASLSALDRPASIAGRSTEEVTVSAAVAYDRLFDEAYSVTWESPANQLDRSTGEWTCPAEGLYLVAPVIEVPPFATPAGKLYTATLRWTVTRAGVAPVQVFSTVGGEDSVPLRVIGIRLAPFSRGDSMFFDLDLTHETKTGTVQVLSILNICRQSAIR